MGRNRATLADVARRAGLSKTAASMVLNGREGTRLSAEAHQRVFAAAEELGYRPNLAARSLRTRKTATIAFVSDIVATTRFAGDLIRGALDAARERDHVLLITETQGDATFEQYAIEAMLDRQVDGVIYAAMATRRLTVSRRQSSAARWCCSTPPARTTCPACSPTTSGPAAPSPPPSRPGPPRPDRADRPQPPQGGRRRGLPGRAGPPARRPSVARRRRRRVLTECFCADGCPSTATPPCAGC